MIAVIVLALLAVAYLGYPAWCRLGISQVAEMPGDDIIPVPATNYTLAIDIAASPVAVYALLLQNGRERIVHAARERTLVFGSGASTWAFELEDAGGWTRVVLRHRRTAASRLLRPFYYARDRSLLRRIERQAEHHFVTRTMASRMDASSGGVGVSR